MSTEIALPTPPEALPVALALPQASSDDQLVAIWPITVAQFPPDIFSRLGEERQHRWVALLAFVLGVVALASAHLLAIQRVHGRVGVDGDGRQFHIGRRPDPLSH